jgi:hypothetical protein
MQTGTDVDNISLTPPRAALVIDIERERNFWKQRYHSLPRARAMRSFVRYWPVLAAAYDIYLNHPHASIEQARERFIDAACVVMSPLNPAEAAHLFGRVLERIHGPGMPVELAPDPTRRDASAQA